MLKFLVTFLFCITAEPEALTIIPSTPADKEAIISHPALISHPNVIFPSKEAVSLRDEPEPEALTPHKHEPFVLAVNDMRGNEGKVNVNKLRDLL